jgi:hypothetical protein
MAINIKSIGANKDIISVSLSASVTDAPAKMSITVLDYGTGPGGTSYVAPSFGSTILNFNGITFAGSLLSVSSNKEQGKKYTTYQYIDGSIYLDQNCIVLYRRGLPGASRVNVCKKIRVNRLRTTVGRNGVSFSIQQKDESYCVKRYSGKSAEGLGTEDFTINPCQQSDVKYDPNEALAIIGAPGVSSGDLEVSYEGSYRSVLSSIYNDFGLYFWWDWRYTQPSKALKSFSGSIKIPTTLPDSGCGVLSSTRGWTREGTYTSSTWVLARQTEYSNTTGSASIIKHDAFSVAPLLQWRYPSARWWLYMNIQAAKIADAVNYRNFGLLGMIDYGTLSVPGASFGSDGSIGKWEWLYKKFNFNWNLDLRSNLLNALNLPGGGYFALVGNIDNFKDPEFNQELFYPYPYLNSTKRNGSLASGSLKIVSTEYDPPMVRRGLNPLSDTFEDRSGTVRFGHWRSVSAWVDGEDEDMLAFDKAVQHCFSQVSADIFIAIFDEDNGYNFINEGGQEVAVPAPGSLRESIEIDGLQIIYVQRPYLSIFPYQGGLKHWGDYTETAGYQDPNSFEEYYNQERIALEKAAEEDDEFDDPCESIITEYDDETEYDDTDDPSRPKPGLTGYGSSGYFVSARGGGSFVVLPSWSALQVVRKTSAQYTEVLEQGNTNPSNVWIRSGGISSSALSHTVNIIDISPGTYDVNEKKYAAEAGGSDTPLQTYSATCDGFFLPVVPTLQSMTATVDSGGLFVSYSYKDIPFKPKLDKYVVSSTPTNISKILS